MNEGIQFKYLNTTSNLLCYAMRTSARKDSTNDNRYRITGWALELNNPEPLPHIIKDQHSVNNK